jgi:hypothetical protein
LEIKKSNNFPSLLRHKEIIKNLETKLKKYSDITKCIFSIEASSLDALYTGQDNGDGTITEKETLKSLENQKRTGLIP